LSHQLASPGGGDDVVAGGGAPVVVVTGGGGGAEVEVCTGGFEVEVASEVLVVEEDAQDMRIMDSRISTLIANQNILVFILSFSLSKFPLKKLSAKSSDVFYQLLILFIQNNQDLLSFHSHLLLI